MDNHSDELAFFELILGEDTTSWSYGTLEKAHDSVKHNPEQLTLLLKNALFIENFETRAGTIVKFLQDAGRQLPKTDGTKQSRRRVGNQMMERLIVPLLNEFQDNYRTKLEIFFELLLSILVLAEHSRDRLRSTGVLQLLVNYQGLLGKIVSSDRSAGFLGQWIGFLGEGYVPAHTLAEWTETVATLCETCGGHDNQEAIDRWISLRKLREHLYQTRTFLRYNEARRLTFSKEMKKLLTQFRLKRPDSESAASATIKNVEVELTFDLLSSLVNSMPCRLCFLRLRGDPGSHAVYVTPEFRQPPGARFNDFDEFEDEGTRLGRWKIVLSAQALKDLQESRSEGNFEHIKKKLEDLSTGDWIRRSLAKPVSVEYLDFRVRLFEAIYGSNGRILWQVDGGYDEGSHKQIVRVWKIGDVKEVKNVYNSVFRDQKTWSAQRIANCKLNYIDRTLGVKVPAVLDGEEQDDRKATDVIRDRNLFEHGIGFDILISGHYKPDLKGQFHVLTNAVFDNITHGNDNAKFPFDVSSTEMKVIKHFQTAGFILGRSGTGKTTCLLYKLLGRYLASAQNAAIGNRLRQVLITRSEPLARKLKWELHGLIKAQLLSQKATEENGATQASIGDAEEVEAPQGNINMATSRCLFSLQATDFPLVCTFDEFLVLLQNTIRAHDRQDFSDRNTSHGVDFTVFKAAYWPKMHVPKNVASDPGLIYSELMGVIKGAGSSKNNFRPLSRDEYIQRSANLAPGFPTLNEREQLYALYERYELLKRRRLEYDGIDKVFGILDAVRSPSMQRRLYDIVQEIYVDEVQDQRAIELELLLHLVQNSRGIHFAGDSAQCISNDSAFRFANIKALFFDHYSQCGSQNVIPQLFSLSKNFRSHQGILSLASFVMKLLWKGFPRMVDKLSPEIGQSPGPKPVIFVGSDIDELLIRGGNLKHDGAANKQTIIVRDEKTASALRSKLKANSILYTILQSKGMEYEDVYLYNFFSSSPYPSGWRTVDVLLPEGANGWYASQHLAMCSELKNLYVAITRPKRRLWILETKSNAFIELLGSTRLEKPLVNVRSFELQDLPAYFAGDLRPSAATKAEWDREGEQCMDQKLYKQALECFQNSGDTKNIKWVGACIAEEKGREHRAKGEIDLFKEHFEKAAEGFQIVNKISNAAKCLEALDEFVKAAELRLQQGRYEHAGILYERAGQNYVQNAVKAYYKAKLPIVALNLLLRAELYQNFVEEFSRYKSQITETLRGPIARKLNALLRQGKVPEQLRGQAFNLLESDQERKRFLKDCKHFNELWCFLAKRGKLDEAMDELMDASKLDLLLKNAFQADKGWQESQRERLTLIHNCVSANQLLSAISTGSDELIDTVLQSGLNSPYAKASWGEQWRNQLQVMEGIIRSGVLPARSTLNEISPWSANFLTAILLLYPDFYLKGVDSLSQLAITITYIEWMSFSLDKLEIPIAVATCLGLLDIGGKRYSVFPWSVVAAGQTTSSYQQMTVLAVVMQLEVKLITALDKLQKSTSGVLSKAFQSCSLCLHQATQSLCSNAGKVNQGQHTQHGCYVMQSPVIFWRRLSNIVEICRKIEDISEPWGKEPSDLKVRIDFSVILEHIWKLLDNLRTLVQGGKLVSYDIELVSTFEGLIVLLLFTGWQAEPLLPNSWSQQYIPNWLLFFRKSSGDEQLQCQQAFRELMLLFCNLGDQLQDAGDVNRKLFIRKTLNILLVGLINVCMTNTGQSNVNFGDLILTTQKILRRKLSILKTSIQETPGCVSLIQPLVNAFKYYNGKDHLSIFICKNRYGIPLSPHITQLRTLGIHVESKPDCSVSSECSTHVVLQTPPTTSSLVMVMLRWNAANVIQRRFRAYLYRKAEARGAKTIH